MDNALTQIQAQLNALRLGYLTQLPAKVEQLIQGWQALAPGSGTPLTPEALASLSQFYRQAHTLAGSSATYNFNAVSEQARLIEFCCKESVEGQVWLSSEQQERIRAGLERLQQAAQAAVLPPDPAVTPAISYVAVSSAEANQLAHCLQQSGFKARILDLTPELQTALDSVAEPIGLDSDPSLEGNVADPDLSIAIEVPLSDPETAVQSVLVVDDDADIAALLCSWLDSCDYQVDRVESGEAGLSWLQQHKADLMFLDILMPGISGLEVLKQVREQKLDMAVVMTTAFGSEQVAIKALRQGADDYLHKPIDPREFQAVLQRTVGNLELRRQNAALRRQLEIEIARAAEIQADLLPQEIPHLPGFALAARCLPAREVGGDFYDWQAPTEGLFNLILGDVMGKGLPAALLMATVRSAMRALSRHTDPLVNLHYAVDALAPDLLRAETFVTLFHAQLEIATGRIRYVDAGHGHVVIVRKDGTLQDLRPRGMPLGTFLWTEYQYKQGEATLDPGDTLLVYSDGLLDARPSLAKDRSPLVDVVQASSTATEMLDRILGLALDELVGSQPDDLTVLVLQCLGEASG